jgi:hypothetical protein
MLKRKQRQMEKKMLNHEMKVWMLVMAIECGKDVWHTI